MYQNLFIGNKVVRLDNIDSTNSYTKELVSQKMDLIEGLIVIAKNQTAGKGQMGNKWLSEEGKNLTCSILLKPKLNVDEQFLVSKVISLGIVDFLRDLKVDKVTIKWPNDIYVNDSKIAGILIENTLKGSKIDASIIGIGLNVNQLNFEEGIKNATSMKLLKQTTFKIEDVLKSLLFFIERRYLLLKQLDSKKIDSDYLLNLYRFNNIGRYEIKGEIIEAKIIGIAPSGKLKMLLNGTTNEFDLKELKFIT